MSKTHNKITKTSTKIKLKLEKKLNINTNYNSISMILKKIKQKHVYVPTYCCNAKKKKV